MKTGVDLKLFLDEFTCKPDAVLAEFVLNLLLVFVNDFQYKISNLVYHLSTHGRMRPGLPEREQVLESEESDEELGEDDVSRPLTLAFLLLAIMPNWSLEAPTLAVVRRKGS